MDADSPTERPDSTVQLLGRFRAGDCEALDLLFQRYVPRLQRWASGRLPRWARDMADTHDLVQEAVLQTFKNIEGFEHRGEGALHAYLRQAVLNRIRDELRRAGRRPDSTEVNDALAADETSPLEAAIGRELLESYEQALQRLDADDREAIVGRVELGLSYAELAEAMGKPTADASRMAVSRALVKLAEEMGRE